MLIQNIYWIKSKNIASKKYLFWSLQRSLYSFLYSNLWDWNIAVENSWSKVCLVILNSSSIVSSRLWSIINFLLNSLKSSIVLDFFLSIFFFFFSKVFYASMIESSFVCMLFMTASLKFYFRLYASFLTLIEALRAFSSKSFFFCFYTMMFLTNSNSSSWINESMLK